LGGAGVVGVLGGGGGGGGGGGRPVNANVLLRGKRCPIVGLVTMDMTLVETGTLEVQVGDVATIVGEEAKQRITLDEFAGWSGELQREFLTGLGARLPRVYG
jgi:alanine racemase